MNASDFNTSYLAPALAWFKTEITGIPVTRDVHVLMLAIAGQESDWADVEQTGGGPGRGPWQFEPETCYEILNNPASRFSALKVGMALSVLAEGQEIYNAILGNSKLATAMARLDLWCDARPIPTAGNQDNAWGTYIRIWRPGKPRPTDWVKNYQAALAAVPEESP